MAHLSRQYRFQQASPGTQAETQQPPQPTCAVAAQQTLVPSPRRTPQNNTGKLAPPSEAGEEPAPEARFIAYQPADESRHALRRRADFRRLQGDPVERANRQLELLLERDLM